MTAAEKLARHIWRLSYMRGRLDGLPVNRDTLSGIDQLLEKACQAIGAGDDGRIEAVGFELEAVIVSTHKNPAGKVH